MKWEFNYFFVILTIRLWRMMKNVQDRKSALCSNSPSSRGKNFGKHLPVSNTYPFSCKPFPFCFKKAMRDHGLKANQIAILGDQMYTDILGGNIWGLYTILTAPIAIKDRNITKVFRFFEELIYGYLEKKKLLKRGDFDD